MTEVQVQGARVTQLRYDHAVTVLIGDWCLRIEEPFLLRVGRAEWLVNPARSGLKCSASCTARCAAA